VDIIYQSHYNSKLNKCFYFVKIDNASGSMSWQLWDINENKKYSEYVVFNGKLDHCNVQGKICRTKEEFEGLIKPFMED